MTAHDAHDDHALVGAALRDPGVSGYVTLALKEGRFPDQCPLLTLALAVSVLRERGRGGIDAVLALLGEWGEADRVGGREVLEALAGADAAKAAAEVLRARLAALPDVHEEPTVRDAAWMLEAAEA